MNACICRNIAIYHKKLPCFMTFPLYKRAHSKIYFSNFENYYIFGWSQYWDSLIWIRYLRYKYNFVKSHANFVMWVCILYCDKLPESFTLKKCRLIDGFKTLVNFHLALLLCVYDLLVKYINIRRDWYTTRGQKLESNKSESQYFLKRAGFQKTNLYPLDPTSLSFFLHLVNITISKKISLQLMGFWDI